MTAPVKPSGADSRVHLWGRMPSELTYSNRLARCKGVGVDRFVIDRGAARAGGHLRWPGG
jgi:hypothetical protein